MFRYAHVAQIGDGQGTQKYKAESIIILKLIMCMVMGYQVNNRMIRTICTDLMRPVWSIQ